MIDARAARNEPEEYRRRLARKGAAAAFDAWLAADGAWRASRSARRRSPREHEAQGQADARAARGAARRQGAAPAGGAGAGSGRGRPGRARPARAEPSRRRRAGRLGGGRRSRAAARRRAAATRRPEGAHRARPLRHGAGGPDVGSPVRLLARGHRAPGARALLVRARPAGGEGLRDRAAAGPGAGGGARRNRGLPVGRGKRLRARGGRASTSRARPRSRLRACTPARSSSRTSCRCATSPFRRASVARRAPPGATRAG